MTLVASLFLSGSKRSFHAEQFFHTRDSSTAHLEWRFGTKASLVLGNRSMSDVSLQLSLDNTDSTTNKVVLRSQSKVAIPLRRSKKNLSAFLRVDDGVSTWKAIATDRVVLRDRFGIDVTNRPLPRAFAPFGLPSFSIDDAALVDLLGDLTACDRIELIGETPVFSAGVNRAIYSKQKPGYVYLLLHPLHDGWVKIGCTVDLPGRLSTYQTSDPLRRFRLIRYRGG
jgi:hypothetical protein